MNWYKGVRSAAFVAQNGRTPGEDCTVSQLQRGHVDHTFLPWINKMMNMLQERALGVRKDFDTVFGKFITKIYALIEKDWKEMESRHPLPDRPKRVQQAQNANQIQIITCTNSKGHFSCGEIGRVLTLLSLFNYSNLLLARNSSR